MERCAYEWNRRLIFAGSLVVLVGLLLASTAAAGTPNADLCA